MPSRWGLGPVFHFEWRVASRRRQMYAGRSLFVAALLAALTVVWLAKVDGPFRPLTRNQLAAVGEYFFYALIGTQLVLLLLVAPAATAGAVCLDKSRGTLLHVLVTDLSDVEIVLGKLASRLVPVLALVLAGLPVLLLAVLLGGIDPEAVLAAFLIGLGVAVLGTALALAVSVWGTKTHEVLLTVYLLWALWLLAYPTWTGLGPYLGLPGAADWLWLLHPFWLAFAPYTRPGLTGVADAGLFLGVTAGLAAALTVLAVARLRAVAVAQAGKPSGKRRPARARAPRPRAGRWQRALDNNPVLWRECRRQWPSRWVRLLWVAFLLATAGCSLLAAADGNPSLAAWVSGLSVAIGLPLLCAAAVIAVAEERAHGTLVVLLSTPLPSRSILWGKWWGVFRKALLLAVCPAVLSAVLALKHGRPAGPVVIVGLVLAHGAAVTSLGLLAAVWTPRLGRALTASLVAYVGVAVGWMFLVIAWTGGPRGEGLAMASPFFGVGSLTFHTGAPYQRYDEILPWAVLWVVVFGGVAAVLYVLTLRLFDRRLGRIVPPAWRSRQAGWAGISIDGPRPLGSGAAGIAP